MMSLFLESGNFNSFPFLIVLVNVYAYVFTLLCFFLFIFTLKVNSSASINSFKLLIETSFTYNSLIFLFLNLAGLPPFFGFLGKFLILILLLENTSYALLILFLVYNCFTIYFYVQHTKQLITRYKNYKENFPKVSLSIIILTQLLLFLLLTAVFYLETILILLYPASFF